MRVICTSSSGLARGRLTEGKTYEAEFTKGSSGADAYRLEDDTGEIHLFLVRRFKPAEIKKNPFKVEW